MSTVAHLAHATSWAPMCVTATPPKTSRMKSCAKSITRGCVTTANLAGGTPYGSGQRETATALVRDALCSTSARASNVTRTAWLNSTACASATCMTSHEQRDQLPQPRRGHQLQCKRHPSSDTVVPTAPHLTKGTTPEPLQDQMPAEAPSQLCPAPPSQLTA